MPKKLGANASLNKFGSQPKNDASKKVIKKNSNNLSKNAIVLEIDQGYVIKAEKLISVEHGTLEPGFVTISADGMIENVSGTLRATDMTLPMQTVDILIPGLVDIHNHGYGGAPELEWHWENPAYTLERLAKNGTTSVLASIMYPAEKLDKVKCMSKDLIDNWVGKHTTNSAVIMGLHAEGPIIASLGGLPPAKNSSEL